MLYSCPRFKHVWSVLSNCLKLNIMFKHVILGVPCQNYLSENKNICIVIISFTIYSTWCKCTWNNGDYRSINIIEMIKQ